jgi:hypothetical protein
VDEANEILSTARCEADHSKAIRTEAEALNATLCDRIAAAERAGVRHRDAEAKASEVCAIFEGKISLLHRRLSELQGS